MSPCKMRGTPDTVSRAMQQQADELGVNYMNMAMFFGTMPLAAALHSIELFSAEVMPRFASDHA